MLRPTGLIALSVFVLAQSLAGQDRWGPSCRQQERGDESGERYCTVVEETLRGGGPIRVNAHPNGGVTVVGWDRSEIVLRARIQARGRSEERAEEIGRSVRLAIEGTQVGVDGPRVGRRGIDVADVRGRLDLETVNGGVELAVPARYSADLEAGTVNGGIDIDFPVQVSGRLNRRLETTLGNGGPPVRVSTTNGGVTIRRG